MKITRFKKVLSFLELEGQGLGIIMGVTRLLFLGPWNKISKMTKYFFGDCHQAALELKDFSVLLLDTSYISCKLRD
jgi:hypothetical protein